MKCLRCNGKGTERKKPNQPRKVCQWCGGTKVEPQCAKGHLGCYKEGDHE